jgi:CarD family transcriptional regulator
MYAIGDYVICLGGGVWRVDRLSGDKISLVKHGGEETKIVPVGGNEIIRKIASKEAVLDVIDRLPFIRTVQAPNDKIRKEFYDKAMSQYDEVEWASVIKTVYLRQKERRLMDSELSYGQQAKEFLHGEISVLLELSLDKVEEYITRVINDSI